jgi:hypothetical protein
MPAAGPGAVAATEVPVNGPVPDLTFTFGILPYSFEDMGIPGPGQNFFLYSALTADGRHFTSSYFASLPHCTLTAASMSQACLYATGLIQCHHPPTLSSSSSLSIPSPCEACIFLFYVI